MQPLAELQESWLEAVMTDQPGLLRSAIAQPPRDSTDVRIAIYTEGYLLRLLEALSIIFPFTKKIIGSIYFQQSPGFLLITLCCWLSLANYFF